MGGSFSDFSTPTNFGVEDEGEKAPLCPSPSRKELHFPPVPTTLFNAWQRRSGR